MFFNAKNRFLEAFEPKCSYPRSKQGHLKIKRKGSLISERERPVSTRINWTQPTTATGA